MARGAVLLLAAGLLVGCVHDAVLENDVRSAVWKARTLSTATDVSLAHAALSAELVELEALHQRAPEDARIRELLQRGYSLMARGFVELRRVEAVASGDAARAEQELQLRADAEARARYYGGGKKPPELALDRALRSAEEACGKRDRAEYERRLELLLAESPGSPEQRLERALARRLATAWLAPSVAARCKF